MGMTHYWQRPTELPKEAFRAAVDDCQTLLGSGRIEVAGFDGTGTPLLNDEQIVFNGQAPTACEPFEIAAVEFDRRGRPHIISHCKTEHLPYDLYVKASLIVFAHHLGDVFQVTSDANDAGWDEARSFTEGCLGYGSDFTLSKD